MKRTTFGSIAVTGIGVAAFAFTPLNAYARRFVDYVTLQPTSPGTQDNGHINVKGNVISGGGFQGDGSGLTNVTAQGFNLPLTSSGPGGLILNNTTTVANFNYTLSASGIFGIYAHGTDNALFVDGSGTGTGTGQFKASSGTGVYGYTQGTSGYAIGVYGWANAAGAIGVYARNDQGVGLKGYSPVSNAIVATSGGNDALVATTTASNKSAIYGYTSIADSRGAWFQSNATTGGGVGVVGQTNAPNGYGVFSYGNTGATGTKSFLIDDPTDPANATLRHYSEEGPEPLNEYTGTVRTDAKGYAVIRLPDYFDALNKDPRYQLTVVDETDSPDFVLAKVVRKEAYNQFTIRTSKPNVEVSWQVKGVRNDPWMQKNGAPVRQQKSEANKGKYLQPELYGQPASAGIAYQSPVPVTIPPTARALKSNTR